MIERKLYTARLVRAVQLSADTKHLEFVVEELPKFEFVAGQFVSMLADHNGRKLTRAYSIASPPRGDNTFDLCLNRVPHGYFSNHLCDLQVGDTAQFHGPHGHFVLRQPIRDSLLVATGSGIAPLRGMLQWLFADESRHRGHQFWLLFGARFPNLLYYDKEFRAIAAKHPNFHYMPSLSRPTSKWTGLRGYVQTHVAEIVGDRTDMDAYICGLKDMVNANRVLLKGIGWERKQIVFERFD